MMEKWGKRMDVTAHSSFSTLRWFPNGLLYHLQMVSFREERKQALVLDFVAVAMLATMESPSSDVS